MNNTPIPESLEQLALTEPEIERIWKKGLADHPYYEPDAWGFFKLMADAQLSKISPLIAKLEAENKELKDELETAYGIINRANIQP